MIELPESRTLAAQLKETLQGKRVCKVITAQSPHKFAFYWGDHTLYGELLSGKEVTGARYYGGRVDLLLDGVVADFFDGMNLTYCEDVSKAPVKHQILLGFEDGSALYGCAAMYGGAFVFREGEMDNIYYQAAKDKPDPFSGDFSDGYFESLLKSCDLKKLSAKAFLATEQRIPGLGNGVLQDILFVAGVHPKTKMVQLSDARTETLFKTVKHLLAKMADAGGRDTEKDIFGKPGAYKTIMSKNNTAMLCPSCGGPVTKQAYMGGSVYFCSACQPLGS